MCVGGDQGGEEGGGERGGGVGEGGGGEEGGKYDDILVSLFPFSRARAGAKLRLFSFLLVSSRAPLDGVTLAGAFSRVALGASLVSARKRFSRARALLAPAPHEASSISIFGARSRKSMATH